MSSSAHDVPKMVVVYKKLFLLIVLVTILGIGIAFAHLPVWTAILIALGIIAFKGTIVLDSFKPLLTGRHLIVMTFVLTGIFFMVLLILPFLNHNNRIVGTVDISKELQMQEQQPIEAKSHGN